MCLFFFFIVLQQCASAKMYHHLVFVYIISNKIKMIYSHLRLCTGARRFVTLDFGRPVLLTDALIPTCSDLASLSIDIWTLGEEVDGRRLVVATDISTHSLILHDLLPPPVCRFMKVCSARTRAARRASLSFYLHRSVLPVCFRSL